MPILRTLFNLFPKSVQKKMATSPTVNQLVCFLRNPRHIHFSMWGLPVTYKQMGLMTIHNVDSMQDPKFREAYHLGKSTGSWGVFEPIWQAYICCWAGSMTRDLEGDFVECGVNRGGLSRTVINYLDFGKMPKNFWLIDTFDTYPGDEYIDGEESKENTEMSGETKYNKVVHTFKKLGNVKVIKGRVPDVLGSLNIGKVCYLSIDMNNADPEIAAAEFFWDKLVPGGIMILDDYAFRGRREQKRAFDQFALRKKTQILSLPTGQGFVLKLSNSTK
jgi:O-methyltransferase